jgi:hypothetical protein
MGLSQRSVHGKYIALWDICVYSPYVPREDAVPMRRKAGMSADWRDSTIARCEGYSRYWTEKKVEWKEEIAAWKVNQKVGGGTKGDDGLGHDNEPFVVHRCYPLPTKTARPQSEAAGWFVVFQVPPTLRPRDWESRPTCVYRVPIGLSFHLRHSFGYDIISSNMVNFGSWNWMEQMPSVNM